MKRLSVLAACAVLSTAVLATAPAAQATDYNISAVTNNNFATGVSITFAPGTYTLTPIGIADGGLYNAWNPNSPQGCTGNACSTLWRWGYNFFSSGTTLISIGNNGVYATDTAAIAGEKASPTLGYGSFDTTTSIFTPGAVPNPFTFTIDAPTTLTSFILDNDGNASGNLGGVSFRILPSAPETATWGMMILGFGALGAMLRRRKAALAAV